MDARKLLLALAGVICALLTGCRGETSAQPRKGDLSKHGGSPTVRESFLAASDDPGTTNDESNDQPLGYFGTLTLAVSNNDSGNSYTLDADLEDTTVERVYFPKGGWVDFYDCELDEDLTGSCWDEEGRSWTFDGEGYSGASDWVEEEEIEEQEEEDADTWESEDDEEAYDDDPPVLSLPADFARFQPPLRTMTYPLTDRIT